MVEEAQAGVPVDVPAVAPVDNDNALPKDEVVHNDGSRTGDWGIGSRVWGSIGAIHHVVVDARTTACDKQLDSESTTQRLDMPPGGMLCGVCLGRLVGA